MRRTRVGLIDSGLGLVSFAATLHRADPGIDLLLATDPEHMPYGALEPAQVQERVLASARALEPWAPDALVLACNTASVHALAALRAHAEPEVPVIGTVPAIKSAARASEARGGAPFAVWATSATTASAYQRELISAFAGSTPVASVACAGLAQAIERADDAAIDAAIDAAAAATPAHIDSIVLGCTHYGLVAERIRARRPQTAHLYDSPAAVAAQTLARLDRGAPGTAGGRILAVLASGRPAGLPRALEAYPAGRELLRIAPEQHT